MGKKKKAVVTLNQTELMPTTIGSVNTKQGSPIAVIIIIAIFVAGIFSLDYIVSWLNPETEVTPYVPPTPTPTPTPTDPTTPTETDETTKYEITTDLVIPISTLTFNNFVINTSNNTIDFNVNTTTASNLLETKNYYLELYSSSNILLQRIKLKNEKIIDTTKYSYNITEALSSGGISKISIYEIKEDDYTNVSLTKNSEEQYILTCKKDNETIEYNFANTNNTYSLEGITSKTIISDTDEDYDYLLEKYELLNNEVKGIEGITITLNPARGGFEANTSIDLNTVTTDNLKKYFNESIYYPKDTSAKKVSFELNASYYTCK